MPATVTGLIAPDRMKGETMQACPAWAYTSSAPSIVPSSTIGELQLIRLVRTQFSSTKLSPIAILAISTVSRARSGAVTLPMNGLSL